MNRSIFSLVALLGLLPVAQATAATPEPAGCRLEFKIHVESYVFMSKGSGTGRVTCSNPDGSVRATKPVAIKIDSLGLGIGEFSLRGVAGNLGILDPKEIEGEYAVIEANVGVHGAAGASLGFEGQDNGLSFSGSVSAGHGWGARLNGSTWKISLR